MVLGILLLVKILKLCNYDHFYLLSGCVACSTAKVDWGLDWKEGLRIWQHEKSRGKEIAQGCTQKGEQVLLGSLVRAVSDTVLSKIDPVFRTANYIPKKNRHFTVHHELIKVQQQNGINWGTSLHSSYISIVQPTTDTVALKFWNILHTINADNIVNSIGSAPSKSNSSTKCVVHLLIQIWASENFCSVKYG